MENMFERRGAHCQIVRVLQLTERVRRRVYCCDSCIRPGVLPVQHVRKDSASVELGRNRKSMPDFYSFNSCSFPSHTPTMLIGCVLLFAEYHLHAENGENIPGAYNPTVNIYSVQKTVFPCVSSSSVSN